MTEASIHSINASIHSINDRQISFEDASSRVARLKAELGFDAASITMALLGELDVTGVAEAVLFPLISDRVHHLLRDMARRENELRQAADARREQEARRARAGSGIRARLQAVPRDGLLLTPPELSFLDCKIIISSAPDGYKLYRHLTVAEHQARQLMLEKNGRAVLHSARSHRWAVRQCQRHKAQCLDEIPLEALAGELPEKGVRPLARSFVTAIVSLP